MGLLDFIPVVGPALSAVTSLGTSLLNRHAEKEANKRNAEENELNREYNAEQAEINRKFQVEQANVAFDREKELWKMQNEYDTPKNQIKRLQEAGVNPNVFGGDNTSSSVPVVSAPSGSSASVGSSIPQAPLTMPNPLLEAAQIRLANATAQKYKGDTDLSKAQEERIRALLSGEEEEQRIRINQSKFNLEKLSPAQLNELESKINLADKSSEKLDYDIKQIQETINLLKEQKNLTDEQIRRLQIENESLPVFLASQIRTSLLQGDLYIGQRKLTYEQANKVAHETANVILEGGMIGLDFIQKSASSPAEITIQASENSYLQSKADWKANNPRLAIFLDEGSQFFGGISRGVGSAVGKIGSAFFAK